MTDGPFFLVEAMPAAGEFRLTGPEGRHAAAVRRLRVGENLVITDGRGQRAAGTVLQVGRGELTIQLAAARTVDPPAVRVTLVQALPKGDRGELAVELATEAGVDEIVPWAASRCVARWTADRADRGHARWQNAAREATKQSRRSYLPVVHEVASTAAVAARIRDAAGAVLLHEAAELPLTAVPLPAEGELLLVAGPEGGISEEELVAFREAGAAAVRLGPEVLRTSTAGAVALGALGVLTGRWAGPDEEAVMKISTHQYAYGPHRSQTVQLILPGGIHIPIVVVIHGGYWRSAYGAELAEPLGRDLTRFGIGAAVIEYRRMGEGGGWPTTLADAARAVDSLAVQGQYVAEGRLLLDRVAAVGHSAGGQLAAWLAHRGSLRAGTAGSVGPGEPHVPVVGAVTQAGLLDLVGAANERLGDGAVVALMEGEPRSLPQRYHHASPLAAVGDGARVICVHGDADDTVPLSQSERYVEAARRAGDPAKLIVLPRVGHFELIDPGDAAWEVCRDQLLRMV